MNRIEITLLAALVAGAIVPGPGFAAQERRFTNLEWWHPLVASAGVAALFVMDEPIHDYVQGHRSATLDDVGDMATHFHEPEVFLAAGVGSMSLGLLARNGRLAETGVQIIAAYGLSSGMMIATKWAAGRSRPSLTPDDNLDMHWFRGGADSAFPSGASAVTFSLATTVADAVDRTPVTVLLYTGATVNAWSRVNGGRHWASDVALGALYGVTAAKLVNGRWRVFGFRPPTVGIAADRSLIFGYEIRR